LLMNKENCALKLVDEIILYYDARSKKHQITLLHVSTLSCHHHTLQPTPHKVTHFLQITAVDNTVYKINIFHLKLV